LSETKNLNGEKAREAIVDQEELGILKFLQVN